MVSQEEINNMLQYLERVTYYGGNYLRSLNYDQLFMMFNRIKWAMETYPQEIKNYIHRFPAIVSKVSLTDIEQIDQLNYNELVRLRKKLGINYSKSKVMKSQPSQGQATLAKKVIKDTETRNLVQTIILASGKDTYDHEQILTAEEITSMYGEDISSEELTRRGIVCDQIPSSANSLDKHNEEDERQILIAEILSFKVQVRKRNLNYETLWNLPLEELVMLKKSLTTIDNILGPKPNRLTK